MKRQLSKNELKIIISKLNNIIGQERKKLYPSKDIEIENAKIKNITQAIAAYGAQPNNFIGMLTLTVGKNKFDRIFPNDYESTIKKKTLIMYHSFLYFIEMLKKELKKAGFELIYLMVFELQKDGNLHAHIYFSLDLKAFEILFKFYHNYNKQYVTERKKVKLNKKEAEIIPIGRAQLGIADTFREKLEKLGFNFKYYFNPEKSDRIDWRCINLVNDSEFKSGSWPTLFFYKKEEFKKSYKRICDYIRKEYTKPIRQKAIGSQFVEHNVKMVYEKDNWSEIQKKFIRKVCGRLYVASRLPIQINLYQKKRKEIIKLYPQYRNMNTLITDLLNDKATYKNNILTCPNGKSIKLK